MGFAERLFDDAFAPSSGRTPRSDEFKAGALAKLRLRARDVGDVTCPHRPGTVEADAWFAGTEEGDRIWAGAAALAESDF